MCLRHYSTLVKFMVEAQKAGMTKGHYAFFHFQDFPTPGTFKPFGEGPYENLTGEIEAMRHVKLVK